MFLQIFIKKLDLKYMLQRGWYIFHLILVGIYSIQLDTNH